MLLELWLLTDDVDEDDRLDNDEAVLVLDDDSDESVLVELLL